MKKQNEVKNEVKNERPAKPKRQRKEFIFFLYVPEHGFISTGENGFPVIGGENPIHFSQRNKAMYAIEFFKSMKLADEIMLVRNVG